LHFYGNRRNYPIVRTGFIGQIPEEPIPLEIDYDKRIVETKQRVILVDGTAFHGASGSPVFLMPGFRIKHDEMVQTVFAWLIGIIHGFYDLENPVKERLANTKEPFVIENVNVAIVFPSWRIIEIIESAPFQEYLGTNL
jgi:hypothetical protein